MLRSLTLLFAVGGTSVFAGCASSTDSSQPASAIGSPVRVSVPASVRELATSPSPPAESTPASSVGTGASRISTADSSTDTDYVWAAKLDVTGDGQPELAQLLWDDENRRLILSTSTAFTCTNGDAGSGSIAIGVYGNGNSAGHPPGSGAFIVELDESECGVAAAGLLGCDFDANGDPILCGSAVIDEATGEIVVAAASE